MAHSTSVAPNSTFVVRFWQTWTDAGPCWRGRIEHVQSGEYTTFVDLKEMVAFMRSFGVMVNGGSPLRDER